MRIRAATLGVSFAVASLVLMGAVGCDRADDATGGDDTIADIGVLKAGVETIPKDAPGLEGRLKSVTVQYEFVGDAETAVLKLWGYDRAEGEVNAGAEHERP